MKVRSGFVSNSSSSSFIIGIATIPKEKVPEYKENPEFKEHVFDPAEDVCKQYGDLEDRKNSFMVESFTYENVAISKNSLKDGEAIFYMYESEEQGDSFYCDDDGDLNYDIEIDYDFFDEPKKCEKLVNEIEKLGGQYIMGAGRNG